MKTNGKECYLRPVQRTQITASDIWVELIVWRSIDHESSTDRSLKSISVRYWYCRAHARARTLEQRARDDRSPRASETRSRSTFPVSPSVSIVRMHCKDVRCKDARAPLVQLIRWTSTRKKKKKMTAITYAESKDCKDVEANTSDNGKTPTRQWIKIGRKA